MRLDRGAHLLDPQPDRRRTRRRTRHSATARSRARHSLREAGMRGDEGRTGSQATPDLAQRVQTFVRLAGNAGSARQVAASNGPSGAISIRPSCRRTRGACAPIVRSCQRQHFRRRIDAVEGPAVMHVGSAFSSSPPPAPSTRTRASSGARSAEQHAGHRVQIGKARHEATRPIGITRDRLRIAERRDAIRLMMHPCGISMRARCGRSCGCENPRSARPA